MGRTSAAGVGDLDPDWITLTLLIGEPAAAASLRARKLRRRLSIAALVYLVLVVVSTETAYYYEVVALFLVALGVAFIAPFVRAQRECARLATPYLAYQLGFPVKVGMGGGTLRGWRSLINLQIKRCDELAQGTRPLMEIGLDRSDPTTRYQHLGTKLP
jgi:hypothetical protein